MIRVLLADDHELVREGLAQILDENSGRFTVVGQAQNGAEILAMVDQTEPDVIVMDYSMPQTDTPAIIGKILQLAPGAKILMLTVHENIHYAVRCLESGAHGYVIKSAAVQELVEAIQSVNRGEVYISPRVSQNLLHHLRKPKSHRAGLMALSSREFDLLRFLGSGMSLQDCAQNMAIGTSTASTYRSRLMEKLNLGTTAEIIRFALENEVVG
ncbi:MAG: hypothetical protein CMN05_04915 [Roseibacillus sp.]|jgi:DNA-binding NarL/FixJ family response regulator|nr:hypothetical protein [Roseibacillus sp.]MBP34523.1 hypothetical protein [Roseibacillus sp.]MCP4729173.1 response regulator transcription factor [Roseibacillus sp.]MDP7106952.1 response regulator transcription factor [Roseibacillus sp.]MDP7308765.1 response regulator transcription factor [Roseibacillus sp.]|tara:strand:+ start:6748 stop:7386 length:639 start_codon:yes stop_codon:yes gene_type:complete